MTAARAWWIALAVIAAVSFGGLVVLDLACGAGYWPSVLSALAELGW